MIKVSKEKLKEGRIYDQCKYAEIKLLHNGNNEYNIIMDCEARREQSRSLDLCEMKIDERHCPEDAGCGNCEGRKHKLCAQFI